MRNNEVYLNADGTIAPTTGEGKAGRGLGYDGPWGYPPLVISLANEYKNLRLKSEDVAKFVYRPTACKTSCRLVLVRKNLSAEKGELVLYDVFRYCFYITNRRTGPAEQIVFLANDRCDQENLIEQSDKPTTRRKTDRPADAIIGGAVVACAGGHPMPPMKKRAGDSLV